MTAAIAVEELWGRALAEGRTAHAYLLVGEGAEFAAREFLLQLLCEGSGSGRKPCRACVPCRKLLHGSHPDVRRVEIEGGRGARIGIDQVREIQKDARFQPLESPYKAYVLPEAERLTPEAANSLLKILEDPPGYVLFLLLVRSPRLLPTILSRCQIVRIKPFSSEELAAALGEQGYSPDEVAYGLALARGIPPRSVRLLTPSSLGEEPLRRREALRAEAPELSSTELAERFAQTEDVVEEHEVAVELLVRLTSGKLKPHEVLELAAALTPLPPEKAEVFLWEALRWARDLLLLARGMEPPGALGGDRLETLQAIASRWDAGPLVKAIQRLEKGMSALQANANAQLLWESLLFGLTPLPRAGA